MQALWPDTFVEEANLANYVSHLRKILGKAADGTEFIETVPRSGYRFRLPVNHSIGSAEAQQIRCVAVLPFLDLDGDDGTNSFRDGLTEELINELVQIRCLKVAARTSVWKYRDQSVDVREMGRVLKVDALVEGSVREHAGHLRITAQLVRCSDGCHSWSNTYDRPCGEPLIVQREVSRAISSDLRLQLEPALSSTAAAHALGSPVRTIVLPFRMLRPDEDRTFSVGPCRSHRRRYCLPSTPWRYVPA